MATTYGTMILTIHQWRYQRVQLIQNIPNHHVTTIMKVVVADELQCAIANVIVEAEETIADVATIGKNGPVATQHLAHGKAKSKNIIILSLSTRMMIFGQSRPNFRNGRAPRNLQATTTGTAFHQVHTIPNGAVFQALHQLTENQFHSTPFQQLPQTPFHRSHSNPEKL